MLPTQRTVKGVAEEIHQNPNQQPVPMLKAATVQFSPTTHSGAMGQTLSLFYVLSTPPDLFRLIVVVLEPG